MMIKIYDVNHDDDDDLRWEQWWWWRFELTKNCEGNDGRSLLANTIVGDTEVSAGVLPANLNYDANDGDDNDDDQPFSDDADVADDHNVDFIRFLS